MGQLTGATDLGNVFGYTYDLAGNRLTGVSVGSQFANTLSYDGNGNLTNISYAGGMGGVVPSLGLSWNMFGQLASSTHQNGSVNTLGYDMFGERSAKNGSTLVSFGGNRGGDLTVGLDSFVQTESGAKVIQNHRGDLSALSSADGTGAGRVYDPYGNLLNAWTAGTGVAPTSEYGFTGAEELGNGQTTDLVYMRARYYHPGLGRFISQDPIGFAGGTNLYAYCGNDPINYTDPLGLSPYLSFEGWSWKQYWGDVGAFALGEAKGAAIAAACIACPELGIGMAVVGTGMFAYKSYACGVSSAVSDLIPQDMEGWGELTGGMLVGGGAGLGRFAKCSGKPFLAALERKLGATCFVAGTPVLMADGSSKAIENVKAGDLVLSKDEKTGEIVKRKVVETKVRTAAATLVIETSGGGHVETTAEHPFYVEGKGWTPAGQLAIGNAIVTRAGPSVKVAKIEKKEKLATVYNFEVVDTHSYFVGYIKGYEVWVHNDCGYPVYFEHQLNPAEFGRSDSIHFNRSNAALETALKNDSMLLEKIANHSGQTTEAVLNQVARKNGRHDPIGFTWHHATRAQAGGRSGVMQLVLHEAHAKRHGFYHPTGIGGYAEWARAAGAPPR